MPRSTPSPDDTSPAPAPRPSTPTRSRPSTASTKTHAVTSQGAPGPCSRNLPMLSHWPHRTIEANGLVATSQCFRPLTHACRGMDAADLRIALGHIGLGLVNVYQSGYLHRNISIGNALVLDTPWPSPPLTVEPDKLVNMRDSNHRGLQLEVINLAKRLQEATEKLSLSTCKAVLSDYDFSADLSTFFDKTEHKGPISGTREFLSSDILEAISRGEEHRHDPLDDAWAYFWTAMWATIYAPNKYNKDEENWRRDLRGNKSRSSVVERLFSPRRAWKVSPIIEDMVVHLQIFHRGLQSLETSYVPRVRTACDAVECSLLYHCMMYEVGLLVVEAFLV